ncbi:tRNA-dihydrouridine synthase 2 [Tilletia horrida]|nr:tRNA-dihydrouridine synthase 2 [Tilletia horrida]
MRSTSTSTSASTSTSTRLDSLRSILAPPATTTTMSASVTAAAGPHPRWKQLIQQSINAHIKDEKSVLYHALATFSPAGVSPSGTAGPNAAVPHVRYVVHRGFLNENRSSDTPTGTAPAQPGFTTGTSLLTTSDVRAPKVAQLAQSGGWAELAWWHDSAQLQFRILGQLHVLPRPGHELEAHFPRERLAPARLAGERSGAEAFDWEAERLRVWGKMSPGLLASFARPVPGSEHPNAAKLGDTQGGPGEDDKPAKDELQSPWPQELPQPNKKDGGEADLSEEQKKLLEISKSNFALLVLEPHQVDVVDLARDKRSLFERVTPASSANGGGDEEWKETRLVP